METSRLESLTQAGDVSKTIFDTESTCFIGKNKQLHTTIKISSTKLKVELIVFMNMLFDI